ncbi:MAG: hypothetical protein R3C15_03290 [Thermoleophilia bacterium]
MRSTVAFTVSAAVEGVSLQDTPRLRLEREHGVPRIEKPSSRSNHLRPCWTNRSASAVS